MGSFAGLLRSVAGQCQYTTVSDVKREILKINLNIRHLLYAGSRHIPCFLHIFRTIPFERILEKLVEAK